MTKQLHERRKKVDIWVTLTRVLTISSWGLFIFALIMSYYAAPEKEFGLVRFYDLEIRQFWLTPLTGYLYLILWFSALCSYFCLLLDKYRGRRKRDSKHFNLTMLLTITVAWVVYILVKVNEI